MNHWEIEHTEWPSLHSLSPVAMVSQATTYGKQTKPSLWLMVSIMMYVSHLESCFFITFIYLIWQPRFLACSRQAYDCDH